MTTSECHVLWICQANRANLLCGNVWHFWLEAHCMMVCGKVLHSRLDARCMREHTDCIIMINYFTRRWQRRWLSDLVCSPPLKLRVLGGPVLKWNFHECCKCKCCFLFWHVRILRHDFGEVHKLHGYSFSVTTKMEALYSHFISFYDWSNSRLLIQWERECTRNRAICNNRIN